MTSNLSRFKREAKQFCLNTALHGYRFIILPKRIFLEKFFWTIICLLALITALALLCVAYLSFQEKPTVTVTDTSHYPIWHYHFPAVTICDYNKISRKKAMAFANEIAKEQNLDAEDLAQQLKILFYLFEYRMGQNVPKQNFTKLQAILDRANISIKSALQSVSTNCDDMLMKCLWKSDEKRCDSIFETIITTYGYCCSFNYHALKNHTFSGIMAYKIPKNPRRVSACGYQTGLEVLLNNKPDDFFATLIPSFGLKILIHNPYTFPDWNIQNMLIHLKTVNFIGLTPTITMCTENVKHIEVERRQCWFSYERHLIYFQKYNYRNCMIECRMNLTIEMCQCVPVYFIPRHDLIRSSIPGYNFSNHQIVQESASQKGRCNCLPDCHFIIYSAESSFGILSREFSMNHHNLYGGVHLKNHSVVRVFFNDLVGVKNRTDVKFNWHSLLAFYGGLLGLFMGFSFISGIEIIYFFTVLPLKSTNSSLNRVLKSTSKRKDRIHAVY
uniref:Sodium channel protein Nach-like n=1 Tax=Diabrotica virgifera virgifera TaxID=50390 RepID=A0A6P7F4N0_DIAVI